MDYEALAKQYGGVTIDPAAAQAKQDDERFGFARGGGRVVRDAAAGLLRGAGSIGATLLAPIDIASDAMAGRGLSLQSNRERRSAMDGALSDMGADTQSLSYGAGQLGGEMLGTAGMGGAIANGVARIPGAMAAAPNLINSIRTLGMEAGPFASGFARRNAIRAAGGAIGGAASQAAINPDAQEIGVAAGVSAVAPGVLGVLGRAGSAIGNTARNMRDGGSAQTLRRALDMTPQELQQLAATARAAPTEIVPGAPLTFAQALQSQMGGPRQAGAPAAAKMLERIVVAGPGGKKLAERMAEQNAAMTQALQRQGAETYAGATQMEGERTGSKLAALLRTQFEDEAAAKRAQWEALHGQAARDGVFYRIPQDELEATLRPLGRGYVGDRRQVDALMTTATDIGNEEIAPSMHRAVSVPFDEFQRLRSSAGSAAAALGEKAGSEVQAGVANQMRVALEARADDAAAGNLMPGEIVPAGFAAAYQRARDTERNFRGLYEGNNNISQILNRPFGGTYRLGGNEVLNKVFHGGQGLADDVSRFRDVLNTNNQAPAMEALQKYIMTEAAGKVTAGGGVGNGLVRYTETRAPGLSEALTADQYDALMGVAKHVRNAEGAAAIPGLRGSDTQAKIANALDAGLIDSAGLKGLMRAASIKGVSLEPLRAGLSASMVAFKGRGLSELLADPKLAAAALENKEFVLNAPAAVKAQLAAAVRQASVGYTGD